MFLVDTNILLYAVDVDSEAHAVVRPLVEQWREGEVAWCLSWGICYEFMRIVTHRRIMRRRLSASGAYQWLSALTTGKSFRMLLPGREHGRHLSRILNEQSLLAGNIMHDVETVVLMREHGVRRIVTRDTDFHRFEGIEVIDPLVGSLD